MMRQTPPEKIWTTSYNLPQPFLSWDVIENENGITLNRRRSDIVKELRFVTLFIGMTIFWGLVALIVTPYMWLSPDNPFVYKLFPTFLTVLYYPIAYFLFIKPELPVIKELKQSLKVGETIIFNNTNHTFTERFGIIHSYDDIQNLILAEWSDFYVLNVCLKDRDEAMIDLVGLHQLAMIRPFAKYLASYLRKDLREMTIKELIAEEEARGKDDAAGVLNYD